MQKSFNDLKSKLSEQDVDEIVSIVGSRTRTKARNRLRSILTYGTHTIPSYGIFSRLIKEDGKWS